MLLFTMAEIHLDVHVAENFEPNFYLLTTSTAAVANSGVNWVRTTSGSGSGRTDGPVVIEFSVTTAIKQSDITANVLTGIWIGRRHADADRTDSETNQE